MSQPPLPLKILFLCTGNSARSILGEYLIRQVAPGRFESYSAGAHPSGHVNPHVVRLLRETYGIDASAARSKSWEEFLPDRAKDSSGALTGMAGRQYQETTFDFVVTVCDHAREVCPVWPGQPLVAHWGLPDPASFQGSDEEIARQVAQVAFQMRRRLDLFCSLPLEKMERLKLAEAMGSIGGEGVSLQGSAA